MKLNKSFILVFGLLIVIASLYRVWDGRPLGFAPQIAMAIFAGAVIKNKKWAFVLPILSMFLSDVLYEVLYQYDIFDMKGFYKGQLTNYILFAGMTLIGFMIKRINWLTVLAGAVTASSVFYILSNFFVWLSGAGYQRPKTFTGLMMCYNDGLPFYRGSLLATIIFSAMFFGVYFFMNRFIIKSNRQLA